MKKTIGLLLAAMLLAACEPQNLLKKAEPAPAETSGPKEEAPQAETGGKTPEPAPEDGAGNEEKGPELEAAFFNQIEETDAGKVIQNPENLMALVNKTYALPGTYAPADIIRPAVRFPFGDEDIEKSYMREEAGHALERMFKAAEQEGIFLFAASGYRSYARQEAVFQAEVARVGEEQAVQAVAIPGSSEHQTGLAMDITAESAGFLLTEDFENKAEGKWLKENAHRFGFILRYPKGKEAVTGYQFEPWHFRYVGEKAAETIYENDWTLEEFFQRVKKV